MLSLAPITPGHVDYYLEIASADYYYAGGEPEGVWIGGGAPALGLQGRVGKEELENLMDGFSPYSRDAKLVQNAGKNGVNYRDASGEIRVRHRQQGWDLTFSAPKSVDVVWAVAPLDKRLEFQRCHFDAVRAGIAYLEAEAATCRRGKGGTEREPVRLVCAAFEHGTSRANDPKLHTHVVVANVGVRADGTTGTVESHAFYQHQRAAGAIYRAELSRLLEERCGLLSHRATELTEVMGELVPVKKSWFELDAVPEALCNEWSKRRQEVLDYAAKYGGTSAADLEEAVINSRGKKEIRPRGELLAEWKEQALPFGFTPEDVLALCGRNVRRDYERITYNAVQDALHAITETESVFTRRDLVQHVAENAQGQGVGADRVLKAVDEALENHPRIVRLTEQGKDSAYTTRDMLDLEEKLLGDAEALKGRNRVRASEEALGVTLAMRPTLTAEQKLGSRLGTGKIAR